MENIFFTEESLISSLRLLPYDQDILLASPEQKIKSLFLYKLLVNKTVEAAWHFLAGKFSLFDAQVGETSCQIRGCVLTYLCRKFSLDDNFQKFRLEYNEINAMRLKINWFYDQYCSDFDKKADIYMHQYDAKINLAEFFSKHNLIFEMSPDFLFLSINYFLSKYAKKDPEGIPASIDFEFLKNDVNIVKYAARKLVAHYQKISSRYSCEFILKLAKDNQEINFLYKPLLAMHRIGDSERDVLPCYFFTKIIIEIIRKWCENILIVCHRKYDNGELIDLIPILFKSDGVNFVKQTITSEAIKNSACLVFHGQALYSSKNNIESIDSYVDRFVNFGVVDCILGNAAVHPQYAGQRLREFRHAPCLDLPNEIKHLVESEYQLTRIKAEHEGCSQENQLLFFTKHIYFNKLEFEINHLMMLNENIIAA